MWYPTRYRKVAPSRFVPDAAQTESREMTDRESHIEQAPIQDRDLLQRMSLYFDAVEHRLRHGEGWLIF